MTSTQQCEHAQVIVTPTGSELLPGGVNHGKYVKESRVQWSLKATVQSRGPNGGLYIKGDKDARSQDVFRGVLLQDRVGLWPRNVRA